jgi:hypothetical protein
MNDSKRPPLGLDPLRPAAERVAPDPWAAQTELSTRFITPQEREQEGKGPNDPVIGKPVGNDTWELFVSCEPSEGLALQFEARSLAFMAVHDMGVSASLHFLAELAQQRGRPLERLVIRRQGYGTVLATLCFADVQASNGKIIRLYATDVEAADPATRELIQKVLLARARMSVILLGDMSTLQLEVGLDAMGHALADQPGLSRTVVLQPLGAAVALDASLNNLSRKIGVQVRRAPQVQRPVDAWSFLSSTWAFSRVDPPATPTPAVKPASPYDPGLTYQWSTASSPEPSGTGDGGIDFHMPKADPLQSLVAAVAAFKPGVSCCVFSARSLEVQAQAGPEQPAAALLAKQGRMLVATMQASSQLLSLKSVKESVITFEDHLLILKALPGDGAQWLMALVDCREQVDLPAFKALIQRHEAALARGR